MRNLKEVEWQSAKEFKCNCVTRFVWAHNVVLTLGTRAGNMFLRHYASYNILSSGLKINAVKPLYIVSATASKPFCSCDVVKMELM